MSLEGVLDREVIDVHDVFRFVTGRIHAHGAQLPGQRTASSRGFASISPATGDCEQAL